MKIEGISLEINEEKVSITLHLLRIKRVYLYFRIMKYEMYEMNMNISYVYVLFGMSTNNVLILVNQRTKIKDSRMYEIEWKRQYCNY